jgi:hypothetical protein
MNLRFLQVALAVSVLTGCASGGAVINSQTVETTSKPVTRALMFVNAKSPHFTGALYSTFVESTRRRIESCGVSLAVLEFDPLEIDMREKFDSTLRAVRPDAIIWFSRDGGNLLIGDGGVSGNLYFNASMTDGRGERTIWKARVNYSTLTQNMFINDRQSGERFAGQFVSRLAADRLITKCPADVVDPDV